MKIALINQHWSRPVPPGDSTAIWTYEVARRLARVCEVIVYSRGDGRGRGFHHEGVEHRLVSFIPDAILSKGMKALSCCWSARRLFFASQIYCLGYIVQIARDLRARRCDVIHIINFTQFAPIVRAFNPGAKIILHMHCEWLTQLDHALMGRRLRSADMVIACSEYIAEKVRRAFPWFADRCRTVYNGVDLDHFAGKGDRARRDQVKRVVYIGRVSPEKGIHVLIDAFWHVYERFSQARLEVIGPFGVAPKDFIVSLSDDPKVTSLAAFYEGDYLSLLRQRLSPEIMPHVSFAGHVPQAELPGRYQDADVFVFPSVWEEPFGLPIVEAMAAGVPVVATRGGGIPEIVENGKTGLLVDRDDAPALADAISRILADDALSRSMGQAGRQRVLAMFSWDQTVESLLRQYRDVCADAREPSPSSSIPA